MPSNHLKNENSIITCPSCDGSGLGQKGFACSACGGMGLGAFFGKTFLYWGMPLNHITIQLRHLKIAANLLLNLAAYLFGISGLVALGLFIWTAEPKVDFFTFWRAKDFFILYFWLSVISDMFVIYRISEDIYNRKKIAGPSRNEKLQSIQLPSSWDELKKYGNIFSWQGGKGKIGVNKAYAQATLNLVEDAFMLAKKYNHAEITPAHIFFSILKDKEVAAFFTRLNVDGKKLIEKIKNLLLAQAPAKKGNKLCLTNEAKEILVLAYIDAFYFGYSKVKALNLISPSAQIDERIREILYDLEIDDDKIVNMINWFRVNEQLLENYRNFRRMARFKPGSSMDRAYTAVATPVLNHYSYDLTLAAKWGKLPLCVSREREIDEIFANYTAGQSGVILTGAVGTGKRSVAEGVAQLMVKEEVPNFFKDKRLVELDISRLVSGAAAASAEERLLVVIDEVRRAGNIILYIENIENLFGISSGGEQSLDLSEVLAGALERKNIFVLSNASDENYIKYIEGKPLGNQLAKVEIKEPEKNQAIKIIESKIGALEGKYKIYFAYEALEAAVTMSTKYMHDQYLPSKAISILEKTAVAVAKRSADDDSKCFCSEEDIAATVSAITKIPVSKISEKESKQLLNLEEKIHEQMIDQEEAVKVVAASLRRARAELRESKRPIANFLFLGPTGVGKTELAKTISNIYFGDENYMIRLDMSEYQNQDSVSKMIGDAGSKGYLTEAVRKKPFALILLDEFEKAHPEILNLFLQVMDDGRLTDGQGKTIDFTNSIIIATSNAGSLFIQDQIRAGVSLDQIREDLVNKELNKTMKPELINRFDGVVVFKPLSMNDVIAITKLMIDKIRKMLEEKGIGLRAEEKGIEILAQEGFDPKFGARPLRRLLQDKIENEIANKILNNELARRDTIIINDSAQIEIEKGREL